MKYRAHLLREEALSDDDARLQNALAGTLPREASSALKAIAECFRVLPSGYDQSQRWRTGTHGAYRIKIHGPLVAREKATIFLSYGAKNYQGPPTWTPGLAETKKSYFEFNAADLVEAVHRLHLLRQTDRALDLIFRWVDRDLKTTAGKGSTELLASLSVDALDEDLLVGFLTSTFPGKHLIPTRDAFAERAREKLRHDIGRKQADALIRDLR